MSRGSIPVNVDNIPAALKARKQWVCWHGAVTTDANGNPRTTKHPYCAPGGKAKTTDPTDWLTFDVACQLMADADFDGIGFVFSADDPFVGVDLDKCFDPDTGEAEDWALEIIDALESYTEFSPSGTGFHIIVEGSLPPDGRRRGRVEMYEQARYFTFTGNVFDFDLTEIKAANPALTALHERIFADSAAPERAAVPAPDLPLSDEQLIDKASRAKNGIEFERLYQGHFGQYPSQSEADLALCTRLAFWTGGDIERMDRMFRNSGLMRPKWDKKRGAQTYGQKTLAKAVAQCREFYDPQRGQNSARDSRAREESAVQPGQIADVERIKEARERFERQIAETPGDDVDILAVEIAPQIIGWQFPKPIELRLLGQIASKVGISKADLIKSLKPAVQPNGSDPLDDATNDALIDELNQRHAIVRVGGNVFVMNQDYDPGLKRPMLTFSKSTDFLLEYCNRAVTLPHKTTDLGQYWLGHPDRRQYKGVVFSPGTNVDGYYNLFQGFGVKPVLGSCGRFQDFLHDIICAGNDDLYDYIWCWLAHLFQRPAELPGTAIVLRSPEQGTGKNTFVDTIGYLVGSQHYIPLASMHQVTGRFSGHLADLLLIHANEAIWGGDKSAEGVLKAMITDPVETIERKHQDAFSVPNYKRVMISTNNHWPVARDTHDRRIVMCDVSPERQRDREYFGAIRQELQNGGYEALMHALLQVDISEWSPPQIPDHLQELGWDLKIQSGSTVMKWWFGCLQAGYVLPDSSDTPEDWPDSPIIKERLHSRYLSWCERMRIMHPVLMPLFSKELQSWDVQVGKNRFDGSQRHCFRLPDLARARERFSAVVGIPEEIWDTDIVF